MDRQRPYPQTSSPSTETLVAALLAAPASAGDTRVLAIDGRSGAGKSTLAMALGAELGARVVSLEDLYGGWDGLEHGIELARSAVLEPLAAGRCARVPRYDWHAQRWQEPWLLQPPGVLVVEGVGAGAFALYTSVLVWVELRAEARRERALARAYGELYEPNWERWAQQEQAYLERERPRERADYVLKLTEHDAPNT